MNKNNAIGWLLIVAVMVGFFWYQSKQVEKQVAYQAQLDSLARVEQLRADSIYAATHISDTNNVAVSLDSLSSALPAGAVYKDSLLESAAKAEETLVVLENDKLALTLTTKGAQPYSANVKNYSNFDGSDLYIFKGGDSEMGYSIYTGEYINTKDFVFDIVSQTDSSVVMRLAFANGGSIEQSYVLHNDSYLVDNVLSFSNIDEFIPRNVSMIDMDWNVTVPRMEKGYKNESQYSMLDYYFSGEKKPSQIGRGRNGTKRIDSKLSWFAFHQQFFSAIMRAKNEFGSGELAINFLPESDEGHNLMKCSASMRSDLVRNGQSSVFENEFYFGPNHFITLKNIGQKYEKIIPLGGWLVGWFTRFVIIPLFNFFSKFINNFGLIILLMTLVIKTALLPLTNKSYLASAKMSALKPELDKINAKYPKQEDAMKKQQATMDLYKRANVNPMGGCLPTLITFPVLWAMFRFFPASIELRQQSFLWCDDLSAYDSIIDFGTRIPLLGDHLSLFALLMALTMFFYSKITMSSQPNSDDPNAVSMRFMSLYMMPIMMFFICNSLSAALSYYYLLSNLYMMAQNWVLRKFFVKPDEILAQLAASKNKPVQKSKWQQKLEEAQKAQEKMLKEQQKQQRRK